MSDKIAAMSDKTAAMSGSTTVKIHMETTESFFEMLLKYLSPAPITLLLGLYLTVAAQAQEAVINMESTVQGNQEQPTVLYIVPWKPPEGPAALYQSIDSQLQAVFSHVDRAEFRRQLYYIKEMSDTQEEQ